MIRSAMIIAAGRGIRLRPLTDNTPKPLITFDGQTLLHQVAYQLRSYGVEHFYYSLGYKWQDILAYIQADPVLRQSCGGYFVDVTMPGTAYWIWSPMLKRSNSPLLVSTADNPMELDARALWRDYVKCGRPACLMIPVEAHGHAGTRIEYSRNSRRVLRVQEGRSHHTGLIGSGLQVINPKKIVTLTKAPRQSFQEVWTDLIASGELYVSRVLPSRWKAIDDEADLKKAQAEMVAFSAK